MKAGSGLHLRPLGEQPERSHCQGQELVGIAAWTHPLPSRRSAVGWCGEFAVFMWSISVQVGGFHPSTASYSPAELTAEQTSQPARRGMG